MKGICEIFITQSIQKVFLKCFVKTLYEKYLHL